MRRAAARGALLAGALVVVLLGCTTEDDELVADPTPAPSPSDVAVSTPPVTGSPEPEATVLDVAVDGDAVTPSAAAVELDAGEALTLRITSDRAGELHVHARPEQYVEFGPGTSEHELVVDAPGSVEVEEHESGVVVAVLRVGG